MLVFAICLIAILELFLPRQFFFIGAWGRSVAGFLLVVSCAMPVMSLALAVHEALISDEVLCWFVSVRVYSGVRFNGLLLV